MGKPTDEFFRMEPEERNVWLRIRTQAERDALFEALVEDERLRLSDIVQLEEPFRIRLSQFLLGDPQQGISPPQRRRRFRIRPRQGAKVRVQIGSRHGKRVFRSLNGEEELEPAEALLFFDLYGPHAELDNQRGMVEEVTGEREKEARQGKGKR